MDRVVECSDDVEPMMPLGQRPMPGNMMPEGPYRSPMMSMQGGFSALNISPELHPVEMEERDSLRWRVENSGAIPIADAEIMVMSDPNAPGVSITKERVPFVSGGQLEKLVVNVMLVVYVA